MNNFEKGKVIFKHKPEDFIVEEITNEEKICYVSDTSNLIGKKPNLDNLKLEDKRDFIMFDLEKINIDHFNLISILSTNLKKPIFQIGYAGTKDKIAWTCQRISLFNPSIDKLKEFSHPNICLKNFKWGKHKIKIGDLKGNKFNIILRDIDSNAFKLLNRIRNTKFIPNFFGKQRFGSIRQDNFKIGKLILKKKYKEAIFEYLTNFSDTEKEEIIKAKIKLKKEKDLLLAREYFPKQLIRENNILDYLKENKNDFLGAIKTIDKKVLLLMCQSVQSRIFDLILERLLETKNISEKDSICVPGYDFIDNKLKFTEEILREQNINLTDFKNESFSLLNLRSFKRKAFLEVKSIRVEIKDDEIFTGSKKIELNFILDSGSYATTFLEYFFKIN